MKLKFVISILVILFLSVPCFAMEVTLKWGASSGPDLVGYNVHYTSTSGAPYETVVDVGDVLITTLTLDIALDYCFVVTAYNSQGRPSLFSNEVCTYDIEAPIGCLIIEVTP